MFKGEIRLNALGGSGRELIIAALGDSLTYGWMTERGYLDYLKTMFDTKYPDSSYKILNRGIPGDTAEDGLRRVDKDILRFTPAQLEPWSVDR